MVIMFGIGVISFCLVGSMWIISSLVHRPIIGNGNIKSGKDLDDKKGSLDEQQAAVTTATWSILHPPS
jgi:hypothetical protein